MNYKDIILPNYDYCIHNTITSILKNYDVKTNNKSLETLDEVFKAKDYKNVIFLILDGLGEHILEKVSPDGFFSKNKIDCVTSVCPSTTTAALPVYYSGKVPYETGWIGWSQYFKEYGRSLDMFTHKESYLGNYLKNPIKNMFEEELNYESIFYQIEKASPNVRAIEVQPQYAEQMAKRSVRANNLDEIETAIYDICSMPGKNFIVAYSDNPDGLLHKYGTDSQEAKEFIKDAEKRIQKIRANLDEETLIIISADHGHKNIEKAYSIINYPEIMECLIIPPTLESRALSFWVKDEMKDEFVKRFNKEFEKEFWLMSKDEFLNKYKMLGTGEKHKKIDDFIGNFVALSVGSSIIRIETFLAEGKPVKKSTHCGLTKDEMEVPVIVLK